MMKISPFGTVPQAGGMGEALFRHRLSNAVQDARPDPSIRRGATSGMAESAEAGHAPLSGEDALQAIADIHEFFENEEIRAGHDAPTEAQRRRSFNLLRDAEQLHRTLSDEVNLRQREYHQASTLPYVSPRLAVLDSDGDGVCQPFQVRPCALGEGVLLCGGALQQSQYREMRAGRLLDEIRQMASGTVGGLASLLL